MTRSSMTEVRASKRKRGRRRRWRGAIRPRWNEAREPILVAIALSSLALGTIGYLQAPGQRFDFFDSFYRALQLYGFGGAVAFKVPATLQVARLLAPFALGLAAIQGILHLFRDEMQVLRIRLFVRDHVVVVGLGSAGSRLVRSFYDEGWEVVVVERDPINPSIPAALELGVPVLIGDGRHPGPLHRARVGRARYLLATCGDDGVNFDVAMAAAERVATRARGVLTAFAHITDLRLWRGLKAQGVAAVDSPAFRLELFNVFFTAAHLMVDETSPFSDGEGNELEHPHVCIVGLDGVGEGLVLRIASTWRERHPDRRLRLTIAGPGAEAGLASLVARYPALAEICELGAREAETASAFFQRGGALVGKDGGCDVTRAYVSLASQGESLAAALGLHGGAETATVPVVVALDDGTSGTARALEGCEGPTFARGVTPFGVLSAALTPAITLQGMNELIARRRHAEYVRERLAAGRPSDSTVPWDQLRPEYQESNRRFADGIGAALNAVGCAVAPAPLIDADEERFHFTDAELEVLAEREHERWIADQVRDGWRYGPAKDPACKTHPDLVPWRELDEEARQSDRDAMRDLPRLLAAAGLDVYRIAEAPPPRGDAGRAGVPVSA